MSNTLGRKCVAERSLSLFQKGSIVVVPRSFLWNYRSGGAVKRPIAVPTNIDDVSMTCNLAVTSFV